MQRLTAKVIACPNCGHESRFELEHGDEFEPIISIVKCAEKSRGGCGSKFAIGVSMRIETKTYTLVPFEVS